MVACKYHVYLDWQDFTVHAVPCGSMAPWRYTSLTETLWQIDADNEDDALRSSVETGRMTALIEKTEDALQRKSDYIARFGNNLYNPTIAPCREEMTQIQSKLRHFKEVQEMYAPPVITMPAPLPAAELRYA